MFKLSNDLSILISNFFQASIRATACWFNMTCALSGENGFTNLNPDNMTDQERFRYHGLIRDITNVRKASFNTKVYTPDTNYTN